MPLLGGTFCCAELLDLTLKEGAVVARDGERVLCQALAGGGVRSSLPIEVVAIAEVVG